MDRRPDQEKNLHFQVKMGMCGWGLNINMAQTYFTMYSRYEILQNRTPTPYLRANSFNSWQAGEDRGLVGTAPP